MDRTLRLFPPLSSERVLFSTSTCVFAGLLLYLDYSSFCNGGTSRLAGMGAAPHGEGASPSRQPQQAAFYPVVISRFGVKVRRILYCTVVKRVFFILLVSDGVFSIM